MRGATLTGLGAHRTAPVDNTAVAARLGSSDAWIRSRTGIVTRGVAGADESVVDMAVSAGAKALAAAGVDAADVGLVLLATCSLPGALPHGAPEVAHRLGCTAAGGSDVGAGCAGFVYALALAADAVRAGSADHVLVVGSERMLDVVDPHDRGTAMIFGDGAGAVLVSAAAPGAEGGVARPVWSADGGQRDRLVADGSPPRMRMDGQAVYRWATTTLPALARRACDAAGCTVADLDALVPHQANRRITDSVVAALGLPDRVAVAHDVVDAGNTSAASVPLALARLVERGEVRPGDRALLLGFGAGLAAAGLVVRVP